MDSQLIQSSASRTLNKLSYFPSAKALGYFHLVRFADAQKSLLSNAVIDQCLGHHSDYLPLSFDFPSWQRSSSLVVLPA